MSAFAIWMDRVDRIVWSRAGVSIYDLPDCPFRDWHDDERTAREAAEEALENAGWES